MTQVRQFIDQIANGENNAAKETFENILSVKTFESLDAFKKQMAANIFNGQTEETGELDLDSENIPEIE